jgi:hypothetical protein
MKISRNVGSIVSTTSRVDPEARTSKLMRDLYGGLVSADEERLAMLQDVILNDAVVNSLSNMLYNIIKPSISFMKIDCEDPVLTDLTATDIPERLDVDDWYTINPVVSEPEYTGEII